MTPARVEAILRDLSDGDERVLGLLGRVGMVTAQQVAGLLFSHHATRGSSEAAARKLLGGLWRRGAILSEPLLFRRRGGDARRGYSLSRMGAEALAVLVEDDAASYAPRTLPAPATPGGGRAIARHDLALLDVLLGLRADAQARGEIELPTRAGSSRLRAQLDEANWWGTRHLFLSFAAPGWADSDEGLTHPTRRTVALDGLCLIGVSQLDGEGASALSVGLPLALEYDSSTRPASDLLEQAWLRAMAGLAGAVTRRVPQAAVAPLIRERAGAKTILPYAVPVLFVIAGEERRRDRGGQGRGRAARLEQSYRHLLGRRRLLDADLRVLPHPPILVTTRAELDAGGILAPVASLHRPAGERLPLLRALLADAAALMHADTLHADDELVLDRGGAAIPAPSGRTPVPAAVSSNSGDAR